MFYDPCEKGGVRNDVRSQMSKRCEVFLLLITGKSKFALNDQFIDSHLIEFRPLSRPSDSLSNQGQRLSESYLACGSITGRKKTTIPDQV